MTAPLAVQSTMGPPEARVACAPDAKDRMAAWSRSAQAKTRAMQSLSLRSQAIVLDPDGRQFFYKLVMSPCLNSSSNSLVEGLTLPCPL